MTLKFSFQFMFLVIFLSSSPSASAQDDFSQLRVKTEQEACAVIKNSSSAPNGTCLIPAADWADLSYKIQYQLSGSRVIDTPLPPSPSIGSPLQRKNWVRRSWSYSFSGNTSCELDPKANRWSCKSEIAPFTATGREQRCSCTVGGFASCAMTTACSGAALPLTADGVSLIGPDSVSGSVSGYNETHLFH